MRVSKLGLGLLLWLFIATAQALTFPTLSGRVVDDAHMLDPATRQQLAQKLEAHEKATGEQVVVVTVADLQGTPIEDFGYQLGRAWGIGQKDKNNGALLIVAPLLRSEGAARIVGGGDLVVGNCCFTAALRVGPGRGIARRRGFRARRGALRRRCERRLAQRPGEDAGMQGEHGEQQGIVDALRGVSAHGGRGPLGWRP